MRRFDFNKLPIDVKDKIEDIQWSMGDDDMRFGIIGQVDLNDNWVFVEDYSHTQGFKNKQELIDMVRYQTKRIK